MPVLKTLLEKYATLILFQMRSRKCPVLAKEAKLYASNRRHLFIQRYCMSKFLQKLSNFLKSATIPKLSMELCRETLNNG